MDILVLRMTKCCGGDKKKFKIYLEKKKLIDKSIKRVIDITKKYLHWLEVKNLCYAVWIKKFGIRKTQYLAGFKKPSSIQKCKDLDLEDLKGDIKRFHPLE